MASNKLRILSKATWILLKLIVRVSIKLALWAFALRMIEGIISSSSAITYYIDDFTPTTREVFSLRNLKTLIVLIYICKLLIQIFIWIKYTILSLVKNSTKEISKRFYSEKDKEIELMIRRISAYALDVVLLFLFSLPFTISWRYFLPHNLWVPQIIVFGLPLLKAIYFIYFEQSKKQASLGKKLLKLQVIDTKRNKLSIARAVIRYSFFLCMVLSYTLSKKVFFTKFEKLYSGLIFIVWTIPIFFTKTQATLYDILSKTRVVKISK